MKKRITNTQASKQASKHQKKIIAFHFGWALLGLLPFTFLSLLLFLMDMGAERDAESIERKWRKPLRNSENRISARTRAEPKPKTQHALAVCV